MKKSRFFLLLSLLMSTGLSASINFSTPDFKGVRKENNFNDMVSASVSFNPNIEVNANLGTFKTSIPIALPPNLLNLKNIKLQYNSNNTSNIGYGKGLALNLPSINSSYSNDRIPYKFSGIIGSGELVKVDFDFSELNDTLKLISKDVFKIENAQYSFKAYRPFVDDSFNLFIEVLNNNRKVGWIALEISGNRWVFDSLGRVIQLRDIEKVNNNGRLDSNKLFFKWNSGVLSRVSDEYSWSVNLEYSSKKQKLPKAIHESFEYLPVNIKNITYKEKEMNKGKLLFTYNGDYLAKVVNEGGDLPLFEGEYLDISEKSNAEITPNKIKNHDDMFPVFLTKGNEPTYIKMIPGQDKSTRFPDINNDGIADKVTIDSKKQLDKVYSTYSNLSGSDYEEKKSKHYHIKISKEEFEKPILKSKSEIDIILSYRGKDAVIFSKDDGVQINDNNLKPVFSEQERKDGELTIYDYKYNGHENSMFFIDINSDGKKDLIYCKKDYKLDKENHEISNDQFPRRDKSGEMTNRSFSNLHLKILQLKKHGSVSGIKISDPFAGNGSDSIIYEQKIDNEKLDLLWNQANGNNSGITKSRNAVYWKKSARSFKCNQHSIFNDFNRDGHTDVLTGSDIYLMSPNGNSKKIHIDDLSTLFELGEKDYDLKNTNMSLNDIDGDGILELYQARSIYTEPHTGKIVIVRNGEDEKHIPNKKNKLLSRLLSPFGGHKKITYDYLNGRWTVKYVETDSKGENPVEKHEYNYETPLKDLETGVFTGFYKVKEVIQDINEKNSEPTVIKSYFLKDSGPEAVVFGVRGRISGMLIEKVVTNIDDNKQTEHFVNDWVAFKHSENRVTPFIAEKNYRLIEPDGKFYVSKKTNTKIEFKDSLPSTVEVEEKGHGLNSIHHNLLNDGYKVTKNHYEFFPKLYKRTRKLKSIKGKKNITLRPDVVVKSYSDFGTPTEVCEKSRCTIYEYDQLGRILVKERYNVYKKTAEYSGKNLLPTKLREEGVVSDGDYLSWDGFDQEFTYDFWGKLHESKKNNQKFSLSYNSDRVLSEVTRSDVSKGLAKGKTTVFTNSYSLDKKIITSNIYGQEFKIYTDGFGRKINTSSITNDNKVRYSGKKVISSDGVLLRQYKPSFESPSSEIIKSIKYDHLGRKYFSKISDISTDYSYDKNCVSVINNGTRRTVECKNSLGVVTGQVHDGEKFNFLTNALGDIYEIDELKTKWKIDEFGNVTYGSSPGTNKKNSPKWRVANVRWNDQGTRVDDKYGYRKDYDYKNRLIRTRDRGTIDVMIYEDSVYKNDLLTDYRLKDFEEEVYMEYKYSYNSYDLLTNLSVDNFENIFKYRQDDLVSAKVYKFSGKNQLTLNFDYKNSELKSVFPIIKSIEKDSLENLTSLTYENGLTIKRIYDDSTSRLKETIVEKGNKQLFKESLSKNEIFQVTSRTIENGLNTKVKPETFSYNNISHQLLTDSSPSLEYTRDHNGNVRTINRSRGSSDKDILTYRNGNMYSMRKGREYYYFFYDGENSIKGACKDYDYIEAEEPDCFYRLTENDYIYENKPVSLIKVAGAATAVLYNKKLYPVVADHLGSVKLMFSEDGNTILWERYYSAWGEKSVKFTENKELESLARKLEKATIWSYAGLIEMPFDNFENYYWSRSRAYSPKIKEWLSVDPLIKWNPRKLIDNPGNWFSVRYSNNDPLNFVDPSGNYFETGWDIYSFNHSYSDYLSNLETKGLFHSDTLKSLAYNIWDGVAILLPGMMGGMGLTLKLVDKGNDTRKLWQINRYDKVVKTKFGNAFRDPKTKLWWSKDKAGHAQSTWKVFEKKGNKLVWKADADKYGSFIKGKHKSNTGKVINTKGK